EAAPEPLVDSTASQRTEGEYCGADCGANPQHVANSLHDPLDLCTCAIESRESEGRDGTYDEVLPSARLVHVKADGFVLEYFAVLMPPVLEPGEQRRPCSPTSNLSTERHGQCRQRRRRLTPDDRPCVSKAGVGYKTQERIARRKQALQHRREQPLSII